MENVRQGGETPDMPPHQLEALSLLPSDKPVVLFARHSLRELAPHGSVNYKLPLTPQGIALAKYWGAQIGRPVTGFYSSPVGRCVDTALHMADGLDIELDVIQEGYLMEPGCYVMEIEKVGKTFLDLGPVGFANEHFQKGLPGVLSPKAGAKKLLDYFQERLCESQGLRIHVSHDTILAAFVYCLLQRQTLEEDDWPQMMEGIFLWFDENQLHWIWRGEPGKLPLDFFNE